jgi:Ca-activated chloride channel homolog
LYLKKVDKRTEEIGVSKKMLYILFFFICILNLHAEGESEGAASASRGVYLAREGVIIPPEDIHIDSNIASIDYHYPNPEGAAGITFRSGNRQISTRGQDGIIHIAIQARRMSFSELPPLNLAFVIDKSGSMSEQNKLAWVKDAFEIFIESVRDKDFVSLVVFDNTAEVVFPSTGMKSAADRERFLQAVLQVQPGGGTNLYEGLQFGYQQVIANFRRDYTNRVLFLTDGVGDSEGILDMANRFDGIGINVSTIGVGTEFDQELMTELGKAGGGSSRFISDRTEMEEIFGSELSRMVVPSARNLQMRLTLSDGIEILDTWGYNHQISGSTILFSQKTLHLGDYETILVSVHHVPGQPRGNRAIAALEVTYEDLSDNNHVLGPFVLQAEFVNRDYPVTGFSDGMVLQSGTMLQFSQNLRRIGELYYNRGVDGPVGGTARTRLRWAFDLATTTRKLLWNVRTRLDDIGFDDEIEILDRYAGILGDELNMRAARVNRATRDDEIAPLETMVLLQDSIQGLFAEVVLALRDADPKVIAVSGFTGGNGKTNGLTRYLDEVAVLEIAAHKSARIVERSKLKEVIEEQKLSLYDLMNTETAIEVGKLLAASHMITGSVIEMASSVVIFSRIIDLESGEVESAAQVIVPRDEETELLLRASGG